jgi:DNA-binding NarL/FixJ family response regulator
MKRESTKQIVDAIRQVHAGKIYADAAVLAKLAERMVGRPTAKQGGTADILSDRELDVFRRLGEGHATRRIAEDLGVSLKTVQTYCMRIKEKLGLADANELTRAAVRWRDSNPA